MLNFQWKKEFETGLPLIDEQHHRIVEMVNRLGLSLNEDGVGQASFHTLLKELRSYALEHFRMEEALMVHYSYPQVDEHRRAHRVIEDKFNSLYEHAMTEHSFPVAQTTVFLTSWVNDHILVVDKKLSLFIKEKSST